MKKSFPLKTVYYRTEGDDFVTLAEGKDIKIDHSYKYNRNGFFQRITDFIAYRLLATPCAYFYTKLKLHERFIGKEKLGSLKKALAPAQEAQKSIPAEKGSTAVTAFISRTDEQKKRPKMHTGKRQGFFIYSNHTQQIADAFTPNVLTFPRKNSVIIHKNNLCLPILGRHLKRLGGLPLPEDMRAAKNFSDEVKRRIGSGEAVTVYPEAHVWEYFTGVRDFPDSVLDLPIRCEAPIFTATRVYKQKSRGRVACDIYIDGPFYPDTAMSKRDARKKLKEEIYTAMCERAKLSDVDVIKYIKLSEQL